MHLPNSKMFVYIVVIAYYDGIRAHIIIVFFFYKNVDFESI